MPLAGRAAALKITASSAIASTNNAATATTGTGSLTGYVQINSTTRRYWSTAPNSPLLFDGATPVGSSLYTINPVAGRFQWRTGDPPAGAYTIDVSYLTASAVAGGRAWTADVSADMFEVTEFGSSGWKQFIPNMTGVQGTIERYWADSSFFDRIAGSDRFMVQLFVSSTAGDRYEGFAYLTGAGANAAVDSIVGERIGFQVDGALYYSTA